MFIVQNQHFRVYFGNAYNSISLDEIVVQQSTEALRSIADQLGVKQIVFLKQEHGVQGMRIQEHNTQSQFFQSAGDYLITQKKDCGIGVVTADCLPIVVYDSITHAVAIIHAGWKGLLAGILQTTVQDLALQCGVVSTNLELYLGPAARPCCYEVQQAFIDQCIQYQEFLHEFIIKTNGKFYFDFRAFIIVIARSLGIEHEKIYTRYNVCTICNPLFCSYRREKEKARRQISMICLH